MEHIVSKSYIDVDYYYNQYGGPDIRSDLDALLERASEAVDLFTGFRISQSGFDSFSDFQKEHIRLAAAAEAAYLEENGGEDGFSPIQMSLGSFSCRTSYSQQERLKRNIPESVKAHLEAAGLLCRSAEVIC